MKTKRDARPLPAPLIAALVAVLAIAAVAGVATAGTAPTAGLRVVPKMGWVAGGEISALTLYRDSELREVMAAQKAAHLNTLYVTVKQFDGRLWYYTDKFPELMATPSRDITYTASDNPLTKVIDAAHAQKPRMAVMVLFQTFLDRHAAWDLFPEARIGRSDFVDPGYVPMQNHLIDIAVDLARRYPVDGISLDFVRYPDGYGDERLPITKPGTREQVITDFVRRFATAVRKVDPSIDLSADVFPLTVSGGDRFAGQDVAKLAETLDWLSPMNYPYDDRLAGNANGLASYQRKLVADGISRVGRADALKPAVQAFFGYGLSDVAAQIDGVREAGGTGAIVYAYDFDIGWKSPAWAQLASHMPERWWERHFREDKTGPALVLLKAVGHSVSIQTDEPSQVTVEYAPAPAQPRGQPAWRKVEDPASAGEGSRGGGGDGEDSTRFARTHAVLLPALQDGRDYLYRVSAVDNLGNRSQSAIKSFTAMGPRKGTSSPATATTPTAAAGPTPKVTGLNDVWATVSWQTPNSPATARVEYGTTRGYGESIEDALLRTSVALRLTDLKGDTVYHYRVISTDAWGRKQVSDDLTFRTPENLASGRPATTSSVVHAGFEADMATDGSIQTRWCSAANSDPQWITVDLGDVQEVGWIGLEWEYAYARAYSIEVSRDGNNWTTVYQTDDGRGGREDIHFNPRLARYVRLTGTRRGTGLGYSLWELKVLQ